MRTTLQRVIDELYAPSAPKERAFVALHKVNKVQKPPVADDKEFKSSKSQTTNYKGITPSKTDENPPVAEQIEQKKK